MKQLFSNCHLLNREKKFEFMSQKPDLLLSCCDLDPKSWRCTKKSFAKRAAQCVVEAAHESTRKKRIISIFAIVLLNKSQHEKWIFHLFSHHQRTSSGYINTRAPQFATENCKFLMIFVLELNFELANIFVHPSFKPNK